jgi:hypothetical protein
MEKMSACKTTMQYSVFNRLGVGPNRKEKKEQPWFELQETGRQCLTKGNISIAVPNSTL